MILDARSRIGPLVAGRAALLNLAINARDAMQDGGATFRIYLPPADVPVGSSIRQARLL